MFAKIQQFEDRFHLIEKQLADPEIINDQQRFKEINLLYRELEPTVRAYQEYKNCLKTIEESEHLLATESDAELKQMAKEDLENSKKRRDILEEEIKILMLPKDPNDEKNAYMEIRQGTGGDEATLFAGNLYEMYKRYIESRGWQIEILSMSPGELGGIKEIVFQINGAGAYGRLKYESGTHRVQRVPKTEASGRVHTSAATVAVFPEDEEVEIEINPADLRIDTFRASGAGGQHINKTDSAVRITHIPSGFAVACQEERSQHKNKDKAMKLLKTRLADHYRREKEAKEASARKSMVGSGDRSEKIRTYNYPQNRVTDHRIELTLHRLDEIMKGDLDEVIDSLIAADRAEKLAAENAKV
jgi:peptide chain release factor 1